MKKNGNVTLAKRLKRRLVINTKLIIRLLQRITFPGFDGVPIYTVIHFFFQGIVNGALTTRASAVAFNFFVAVVPTLIFLFTLIPYIPVKDFQVQLLILIKTIMPDYAFQTVESTLTEVLTRKSSGLLSFGFLAALFFSHNGISSLIDAFNATYHTIETRKFIAQHAIAFLLTIILPLLVAIGVSIMFFGDMALQKMVALGWIEQDITYYLILFARWILIVLLFFFCISFLYYLAPAQRKRFRFFSAGSTLATLLIVITSLGFSYYVNNFAQYNKFYGSLGGLIAFVLWIYFNAFGLILGFDLNASISSASQTHVKHLHSSIAETNAHTHLEPKA